MKLSISSKKTLIFHPANEVEYCVDSVVTALIKMRDGNVDMAVYIKHLKKWVYYAEFCNGSLFGNIKDEDVLEFCINYDE